MPMLGAFNLVLVERFMAINRHTWSVFATELRPCCAHSQLLVLLVVHPMVSSPSVTDIETYGWTDGGTLHEVVPCEKSPFLHTWLYAYAFGEFICLLVSLMSFFQKP